MSPKKVISNLLLAFVLISIGYALGREVTQRSTRASGAGSAATMPDDGYVTVYYLHGTIRCVTCNAIERMTHEVVQRDFASQVERGTIRWKVENFQENDALAKRYDVVTSTVVLSRIQGGREITSRRLDEVWQLSHNPPRFQELIRQSINAMLEGATP